MVVAISEKKLSLHEFIGLVEQFPDRKFKLNAAGAAVAMSPSRSHGLLQGWICRLLQDWLSAGAIPGYGAGTEVAHELGGWRCRPDVAIQPRDVASVPQVAPLLAVEVRSESNTRRELRAKAQRYLEQGAQMVWLVYLETRALELYRADGNRQTLSGADLIEGGATLPDFRVSVSEIFPPPHAD